MKPFLKMKSVAVLVNYPIWSAWPLAFKFAHPHPRSKQFTMKGQGRRSIKNIKAETTSTMEQTVIRADNSEYMKLVAADLATIFEKCPDLKDAKPLTRTEGADIEPYGSIGPFVKHFGQSGTHEVYSLL
jgi:hypothetical protein